MANPLINTSFISKTTKITSAWLNGINDFCQGITTPNANPALSGSALVVTQASPAGSVATTQWEVDERTRHVFDWLTPNQRSAVLSGAGVTDVTTPVQAALDSGYSLDFGDSRCVYAVKTVTFNQSGKTYNFNGAQFLGIDTAAQKGVIDFQANYCVMKGLSVSGNYKSNYVSAIYWHSPISPTLPAKSNHWFNLRLDNCLIGILFGEVFPSVGADAAQSENYIYGFNSRGTQQPLYMNQINGFLEVQGEVLSSKNEWDANNPGVYSFAASCPLQAINGELRVYGDILKTDTQLGYGIQNTTNGIIIVTGEIEIASQVMLLTGGTTYLTDVPHSFWGNASNSWCTMGGNGGNLRISNFTLNKPASSSSANVALVDFAGFTGWDVSIADVRLENQLNLVFGNGSAQTNVWGNGNEVVFDNVFSPLVGSGTAPRFRRATTAPDNILDTTKTDVSGASITTWFLHDFTLTGAIALNGDVPTSPTQTFFNSIQVTPNAGLNGSSSVTSMDLTNLASVRNTAVRVTPGDTFELSGWVKTVGGSGAAQFVAELAGTSGAYFGAVVLADQSTLVTTGWTFMTGLFTVPASTAYIGVGVRGLVNTQVRMAGLKLTRLA